MDNKFAELYQLWSTPDLLKILEFEEDYQPEALEAARDELKRRELSEEELAESKKEIEKFVEDKEAKIREPNVFTQIFGRIWDEVKVSSESSSAHKIIFIFSALYILYSLYVLSDYTRIFKYFAEQTHPRYKMFMGVEYCLNALPLFAAITLAFRQNIGWLLTYGFSVFMILTSLVDLSNIYTIESYRFYFESDAAYWIHVLTQMFWLLSFTTVLIFMVQPPVRKELKVDSTLITYVTVVSAILSVLIIFMFR
jgi:hypothetical protein